MGKVVGTKGHFGNEFKGSRIFFSSLLAAGYVSSWKDHENIMKSSWFHVIKLDHLRALDIWRFIQSDIKRILRCNVPAVLLNT